MTTDYRGTRVTRKTDGVTGTVVEQSYAVNHRVGTLTTLVGVRLDDATERARVGGVMTGDLGWLRSTFTLARSAAVEEVTA